MVAQLSARQSMSTPAKANGAPASDASDSPGARIAIVAAVAAELAPLVRRLRDVREARIGRRLATTGTLGEHHVVLIPCGMGKTNAAQALTALIERLEVGAVLNTGIGGAYPGSGLKVGGVAVAASESYGDEGVETPEGWSPTDLIGIPLLDSDAGRWFNDLPLDPRIVSAASDAMETSGLQARVGPFVTVSACSGTARRGAMLAGRFAAICESMEGAAFAHVALHYGLPFLEIRGISNMVEDRDLSRWQLQRAIDASCEAATAALTAFALAASGVAPESVDRSGPVFTLHGETDQGPHTATSR
jgi:futalosine hydrolase